ncbi:MAG: hypothetical protein AAF571_12585 [Verrucomicrobiota bacterium]
MTAPLVYTLSLTQVALILGGIITAIYGWSLWQPEKAKAAFTAFPRHYPTGVILALIALGWFLWLLLKMDLMEYTVHRPKFLIGFSALGIGSIVYLRDFLAVRALAVILILFGKVLLDAAFLRDESSKFLITILAYLIVIKGMVYTAWPYLMRDGLAWVYADEKRSKIVFGSGLTLGITVLVFGIALY